MINSTKFNDFVAVQNKFVQSKCLVVYYPSTQYQSICIPYNIAEQKFTVGENEDIILKERYVITLTQSALQVLLISPEV